jgi:hypothetical protein
MLLRQHDLLLSTASVSVRQDTVSASDERLENPENEIACERNHRPKKVHNYTGQTRPERKVALSKPAKDSWQRCPNKQNFLQYTSDQGESEKCMPQLGISKSVSLSLFSPHVSLGKLHVSHFPTVHSSERQRDNLFRV